MHRYTLRTKALRLPILATSPRDALRTQVAESAAPGATLELAGVGEWISPWTPTAAWTGPAPSPIDLEPRRRRAPEVVQ